MNPEAIKQISLNLTEAEVSALLALIDLGVKSGGLSVVTNAAVLLQKIQRAKVAEIEKP